MAGSGVRLDDGQRPDLLRLIRTENVGPRAFRNLVNRFGGAHAALEALPSLARRGGSLIPPRIPSPAEAEDEIAALARLNGRFIAIGEPDYPPPLRAIPSISWEPWSPSGRSRPIPKAASRWSKR